MVKRRLLLVLALMLMFSVVLAGCGGNNGAGQSNGAATGEESKTDEKPYELIWYTIGGIPTDLEKVTEEINKYTLEKINATVQLKFIDWGDYNAKMQTIIASGEPYDIAFTSSWANDYVQNARKGAFYELDELIETHGQGIKEVLNPAFLEGSKVNGHNYGIPANKELPAQTVWRFNKQFLDKYNLNITNVQSLESLEPILKAFKEKEPGIYPIPSNIGPFMPFDAVIEGIPVGIYLDGRDYIVINTWDTPEAKQTFATMRQYYEAGYLPPDAATKTDTDFTKTGQWLVDKAHTQPFAEILWSREYGYDVVTKPVHDPIVFNWSVTGSLQAISATSENPQKAMEFLNLLNTDAYLRNLVNFGIEDVHYKKVSENVIETIPDSGYSAATFSLGNIFLTYLSPQDPADKWAQFETFNSSATNAPLLGFNFDASNVNTALAAVKNVMTEFGPSLNTGSVDPNEYLPKAIEKLNAAGLQKIIDEAQLQLDEWLAAKGN